MQSCFNCTGWLHASINTSNKSNQKFTPNSKCKPHFLQTAMVNVYLHLFTIWKHIEGAEVRLHSFLSSVLHKGEWSNSGTGRFYRGNKNTVPIKYEAVWASGVLGVLGKKIIFPPSGILKRDFLNCKPLTIPRTIFRLHPAMTNAILLDYENRVEQKGCGSH